MLLLQNDRCQADLIAILADRGMKHPHALRQMYALYDGTKQSLQTTPDVDVLTSNSSGTLHCLMHNMQHVPWQHWHLCGA